MSEPNLYDQYRQHRDVERLKRRMAGADTTLDEAEVRHEAIWDMVYAARFWGPFTVMALLAGFGEHGGATAWLFGVGSMAVGYGGSDIVYNVVDAAVGKFHPHAARKVRNVCITVFGAALATLALGVHALGIAAGAIAMAVMPFVWARWSVWRMARTDFAKHQRAAAEPNSPAIME